MRNLLLLLLLANLGVLAWFNWILPEPEPAESYDGPGVMLLRELDADAAIIAASRSSASLAQAVSAIDVSASALAGIEPGSALAESCLAIGPFAQVSESDSAMASLVAAGFEPALSIVEEEVWDGYWVYIGGIESRTLAQEMLTKIGASGIEDAYVIPNSDSGVLISLGVFSNITRAGAQAERIGQLGYEATIADRTRTAETRWLELSLSGEETLALDLLQLPGRISRLEERPCPAPAVD